MRLNDVKKAINFGASKQEQISVYEAKAAMCAQLATKAASEGRLGDAQRHIQGIKVNEQIAQNIKSR